MGTFVGKIEDNWITVSGRKSINLLVNCDQDVNKQVQATMCLRMMRSVEIQKPAKKSAISIPYKALLVLLINVDYVFIKKCDKLIFTHTYINHGVLSL